MTNVSFEKNCAENIGTICLTSPTTNLLYYYLLLIGTLVSIDRDDIITLTLTKSIVLH